MNFVVNKAARSDITPGDLHRVFGEPARAIILTTAPSARRRSATGCCLKGRMARRFDRLADALAAPIVEEMAS